MTRFKHVIMPAAACLLLCAAATANATTYTTHYVTTTTTYTNTPVIVDEGPTIVDQPVIVDDGIIDMRTATSRALRAEPGRVERSSLTVNNMGEPIYVFDIRSGDMAHIVRVSAITGQVVGRDTVNPRSGGFWDRLFAPMNTD